MREGAPASSRTYLSIGHLKNASYFSRLTGEVEQHSKFIWGTIKPHEAYAMGAVLSSVAFLEATINEVYADAADDSDPSEILRRIGTGYAMKMPGNLRNLLASLWNTEKFRRTARTLEKFQTAIKLAGREEFELGSAPYQDVALLIRLRNALLHFEPESHYEGDDEPKELERKLHGKFPLNPLAANAWHVPFLPHRCLSHGCTLWAIKSSVALTNEFFSRVGLEGAGYEGASYSSWLAEMVIEYASMQPLEKIAAKHDTSVDHIVEHASKNT
jgi:hypothetical protein